MPNQQPHHHGEHRHDLFSRWLDERNHYFTGKYLTAKDFRDEQAYQIAHHRWHQWGLHGHGIVWGLEVTLDNDACVRVEPGVAIDCWGRELVVSRPVVFPANEPHHLLRHDEHHDEHHHERYADGNAPDDGQDTEDNEVNDRLLGLLYRTRDRDCVPVILNDEHSDQRRVHGRVKEYAKIGYIDYCDQCWSIPKPFDHVTLPEVPKDQQTPIDLHQHNCADEHCACKPSAVVWPGCECGREGFLPLARLRRQNLVWTAEDNSRRYVSSPFFAEQLTHIIGIGWNHGAETKLTELLGNEGAIQPKPKHAAIEVLFDRPLSGTKEEVAALAQLIQLKFNPVDENDCDGDDQPEVVNINGAVLNEERTVLRIEFPCSRIGRFENVRLRLTLNCDMLIDYRGRAVDGEHLHAKVPYWKSGTPTGGRSGDGREGGVFQSWSTIKQSWSTIKKY